MCTDTDTEEPTDEPGLAQQVTLHNSIYAHTQRLRALVIAQSLRDKNMVQRIIDGLGDVHPQFRWMQLIEEEVERMVNRLADRLESVADVD